MTCRFTAELSSSFAYERTYVNTTRFCADRSTSPFSYELLRRATCPDIMDDFAARMIVQNIFCNDADEIGAKYRSPFIIDKSCSVAISVKRNTEIIIVLTYFFDQVMQILRFLGVGFMIRKRTVQIEVHRFSIQWDTLKYLRQDRSGHTIACIDRDFILWPRRNVDK